MSGLSPESVVPETSFDKLPLSPELREAIAELGYTAPTPVQLAVFEPATLGVDLVVQARTGTGKTAAFGMPIVDHLVRRNTAAVQALVLCPTRELALQVSREVSVFGRYRGVRVAAVYGGAPMGRQVLEIQDNAQLVVGTPGRVLDHLQRGTFNPKAVRVLVLDECDEMLSMGFLPQINEILSYLPEQRQTLLFSATLPLAIQRMAETRLRSPQFITLSSDGVGALEVTHIIYPTRDDKPSNLVKILESEDPDSSIIFCNTREETKRVTSFLQQHGYSAEWLNADLPQPDRETVMAATRRGKLRFLVATDVAARGIDISHLTHVINYDFPESAEMYVHRTGRTGRAGRTGTAISLVEPGDVGNVYMLRLTYGIRPIERQLPSARELKSRAETDVIEMLVQTLATDTLQADDMALARRLLTHDQAELVIAALVRHYLGPAAKAQQTAGVARRAKLPAAIEVTAPTPLESPRVSPAPTAGDRPEEPLPAELPPDEPSSNHPEPRDVRRASTADSHAGRRRRAPRQHSSDTSASQEVPAQQSRHRGDDEHHFSYTVMDVAEAPEPLRDLSQGLAEIFVNIGRRDGARAEDFNAVLADLASETEYVRVKQRHAFIAIRKDLVDRAISVLNGATISGRRAVAELARGKNEESCAKAVSPT